MLEEVISVVLIFVGGADGAGRKDMAFNHKSYHSMCPLPASSVTFMIELLTEIPVLLAVTVMM